MYHNGRKMTFKMSQSHFLSENEMRHFCRFLNYCGKYIFFVTLSWTPFFLSVVKGPIVREMGKKACTLTMRSFLCKFFWVGGIHLGNISTCVEMLLSSPKNNNHGGKILFCKLQSLSDVKLDKQVVPGEISLDNQDCKDYPSACTSPKNAYDDSWYIYL